MKCPRCESSVLDERERDGVTVDICRECRGVWLDRSELERIIARAVREQADHEQPAQATQPLPQAPPPQAAQPQGYPPPQPQGYPPQPQGYPPQPPQGCAPPPYPHRYRGDDTPPRGFRRDDQYEYSRDGRRHKKRHWFDSLSDIFD
jgi:uncharacterized protein